VYLFLIGTMLILIFGFKKYLVYKLRKTDVYNDQKELVKQLTDNNEISVQKRIKQILPLRYKLIYVLFVVLAVFCSIICANLSVTNGQIFIKFVVSMLFMMSVGYFINWYSKKRNEFMLAHSDGIYKKMAQNALEIITYMKKPMIVFFVLLGICVFLLIY